MKGDIHRPSAGPSQAGRLPSGDRLMYSSDEGFTHE
jgi:hypothetical protein